MPWYTAIPLLGVDLKYINRKMYQVKMKMREREREEGGGGGGGVY